METIGYYEGLAGRLRGRASGIDYSQVSAIVKEILGRVKTGGDEALFDYTRKFDNISLNSRNIKVSKKEIQEAYSRTNPELVKSLKHAHRNIKKFHEKQLQTIRGEWCFEVEAGVRAGEKTTPIDSVGCYVPGGRAAYPSTVLMTCIPAKVAKVGRIVVVSPPPIQDLVLIAADLCGVSEIHRIGGAQAIAALAYGTESIKKVSKIVGPGNKYVTAAKMLVYGVVDVDMPAGPSEILIIADDSSNPEYAAADLLAQAEHDPDAKCILASTSKNMIKRVEGEIRRQLKESSDRKAILNESLKNVILVQTRNIQESIDFANDYAPEHLEVQTRSPKAVAKKIRNAGAIFIGEYSPVAAGDYASGGNHVLPTGGAARFSSQLSVREFLKTLSVQELSREGLRRLSKTVTSLAETEGLARHAKSVEKRL